MDRSIIVRLFKTQPDAAYDRLVEVLNKIVPANVDEILIALGVPTQSEVLSSVQRSYYDLKTVGIADFTYVDDKGNSVSASSVVPVVPPEPEPISIEVIPEAQPVMVPSSGKLDTPAP